VDFLKSYKVAQLLGQLFSTVKKCINLDKKWVGLDFGRFFSETSSGHPARAQCPKIGFNEFSLWQR
jgi:hypothetical protein